MAIAKTPLIFDDYSVGTTSISPAQHWGNITASTMSETKQHALQGKMFTVSFDIDDVKFNSTMQNPDHIKQKLMNMLVEKMYAEKYIEFTKQHDAHTGVYRFHARIYAVPDTMVRILREKVL